MNTHKDALLSVSTFSLYEEEVLVVIKINCLSDVDKRLEVKGKGKDVYKATLCLGTHLCLSARLSCITRCSIYTEVEVPPIEYHCRGD